MELENFFNEKQVFLLENCEKQLVLKEMLLKLEELGMLENSSKYFPQVIHRESLENTGVGFGLSIPHARTDSVSDLISIFGISEEGVDYQSFDNIPVKYFLLSIFPTEMSTKYLYLVGMMARIFANDVKRKSINDAKTPVDIYSILKDESHSYFEGLQEKNNNDINSNDKLSGVPSSDLDLLIRLDRLHHIYDEGNQSESIITKIEQIKKLIDNRSLTYYAKMRKKCQNPFSIVDKNNCSGCHLEIPTMDMNQIKGDGISICTHCGRFLIIV
ncbi:MAG: PTS sugar transporter subunit IIA [Spirochaetota bacterium]|nr:PTS sugar transporter subunit IIA [Spirochaetota bacterium]